MAGTLAPAEFVYDSVRLPLGKTMCIRVIKIRPSTTPDLSDPIVCDFSILDVDKGTLVHDRETSQQLFHDTNTSSQAQGRVEYQALSYTWGYTTANHAIQLNGTPIRIRENLWDFLHHAREKGLSTYLWVDALCIDQSKNRERNHQVGMMGDIYSRAECVIVWLGVCADEQRDSLESFFNAFEYSKRKPRLKPDQRHAMTALSFMYLPYWSRAWIVQEYYLARRKVIWFGNFQLVPRDMKIVDEYFSHQRLENAPALRLWRVEEALTLTDIQQVAGQLDTFFGLLKIFKLLQCADERDRLFAMLSLLTPREREAISIDPDYSKSTSTLFVDVATCMTKELRSVSTIAPFYILEMMLGPDFTEHSVQMVILDLRALHARILAPDNMRAVDHRCRDTVEGSAAINSAGCARCHKKPFVTAGWQTEGDKEDLAFSMREWQEYVTALLASDDEGHRILGAKYSRDQKLGLGMDESSVQDL